MNEADAIANLLGRKGAAPAPVAAAAAAAPMPVAAAAEPPVTASTAPPVPKYFWGLIAAGVLASAGWIFGSVSVLESALAGGTIGADWGPVRTDLTANLIVFGGLLAISLALMRLIPAPPAAHGLSVLPASALGLGLGVGGMMFSLLQAWLGNHTVVAPAATSAAAGAGTLLLAAALTWFEAAVEEVCFRGWLQRRLALRISPAAAVTAAAVAFSLLHVFGGARSPLSLVNIFLAGLFFGVLALRTGSIWAAVWAHFGWNWAETSLFGLAPNPGAPELGAVLDLDLVGAPIWGGTAEGLNASIAITIVLVALLLPLLALRPDSEKP